jgi:bifunctional UDP-N-acetylglucosamine pyrophosphorylase/glucosamine-1-phosphate N-acetyltransferase
LLLQEHFENGYSATLLTTEFKNASGYGRILRDENGNFLRIVEDKDATEKQKEIHEINPAIYVVSSCVLFEALKNISPQNTQKEYYLTDIFNFIPPDKIGTLKSTDEIEVTGVNSVEQLAKIEKILLSRNLSE